MVLAEMRHHPASKNRDGEKAGKGLHLVIGQKRTEPSLQHLHIENERYRAEHHEHHRDPFDGGIVEISDGRVLGREPAGRHRGHRMDDRVIGCHAHGHVGHGAQPGHGDEHERDRGRDLGSAGQDLLRRVEGLRLEQLHAADLQHRQHGNCHDDDPQTAEPLQQPAPEQDARRSAIQAGDDRGAGGGQARHRFEERVGVARNDPRPVKWQRAERHQCDPGDNGHQHRLPCRKALRDAAIGRKQAEPDKRRHCARTGKDHPVLVVGREIDKSGQQHGHAQRRHQQAGHQHDWAKFGKSGQFSVLAIPGRSSEKAGISTSNSSPAADCI
jgi:hypothetical protein